MGMTKEKVFYDWKEGARFWNEARHFQDRFPIGTVFAPEDFDAWIYQRASPTVRKRIKECPGEHRWNGKWRINQAGPNPHQFGNNAFMIMVIVKGKEWKTCSVQEASDMFTPDRIVYAFAMEAKLNRKYAASKIERGQSCNRELARIEFFAKMAEKVKRDWRAING